MDSIKMEPLCLLEQMVAHEPFSIAQVYTLTPTCTPLPQARSEIIKQVIAQRTAQVEAAQKKKEAQEKTTRTLLIVGGIVVGLTALGVAIYMMRKKAGK